MNDKYSHLLVEEVGVIHSGAIGEFKEIPLIVVRLCETNKMSIFVKWETEHLQKCPFCILKEEKNE